MKILTLTGTRPELIRLSLIIKKLDDLVDHILVYTNQNYDKNLSTIFFDDLGIRKPNYYFDFKFNSVGGFLGTAIMEFENILKEEKPDKILILGDTNSGLLSIISEKYKITVYHMEAGNRCYDNRVPEETNRRIIDTVSTYNLPYTENSKQNLIKEGYHKNFVFKIGNPIFEVLNYYDNQIEESTVLKKLNLLNNNFIEHLPLMNHMVKEYVLVTSHRSENVDDEKNLIGIIHALSTISEQYTVIYPVHPRTRNKLDNINIPIPNNLKLIEPLGFFDFVKLEKNAICIITDSGTVQEEACIFGIPSITIRESTERHETIECGSSILSGINKDAIIESFNIMMNRNNKWIAPSDYLVENVSDIVINVLIGKK